MRVRLTIDVTVEDQDALTKYAKQRFAACWFDNDWEPRSSGDAVAEALVLSNENPSPDMYGISIDSVIHEEIAE